MPSQAPVLLLGLLLTAGCSGASDSPALAPTPTSSQPSATAEPTVTLSMTLSPAARVSSTAVAAGPGDCRLARLTVTLSGSDGAGGHSGLVIRFRNNGSPCEMRAYPGVDGLDASGHSVVHATRSGKGYLGGPGVSTTVVLKRGDTASALLEGLTGPTDDGPPCPQYVALLITPPNETHSVKRSVRAAFCQPTIHPVADGSNGGSHVGG